MLVLVETTDLIFAVDSIPAIFAVTQDPFIVYSSNVFAILGLRAMYFLLADVIHRFHYLKLGLAVVLVFVGVKMLATDVYKIPIGLSLGIIVLVLGAATAASLIWPKIPAQHERLERPPDESHAHPSGQGPAVSPARTTAMDSKGEQKQDDRFDS